MSEAAVPLKRCPQETARSRLLVRTNQSKPALSLGTDASLVSLCRSVIVANLERYPPESFGIIDDQDWEALIMLRHRKTAPKEGSGGLDGTGRRTPALSEKYLHQVEETNPHLSESDVVDKLVWKDCVEYRFREGGLTRPKGLRLPWPLLIEEVKTMVTNLPSGSRSIDRTLQACPMSVALLQVSGVGKSLRKTIKACRDTEDADRISIWEQVLESWKQLAAQDSGQNSTRVKSALADASTQEDLSRVKNCQSWRHLFRVLKDREDKLKSSQGKRMREIRKNLASTRPKIVKVRPAKAKHQRIIARQVQRATTGSARLTPANKKVSMLRQEVSALAARQKTHEPKKKSSFGNAVAFVQSCKAPRKPKPVPKSSIVRTSPGKIMKVPVLRGRGGASNPRLKWK